FTGVDADADLERPVVDDAVADRERCSNGPFGIVLVHDRRTEDGHHGVADELLHGSAMPLELGAKLLVKRPQNRLDILWVERFCSRRETDEVGEEDSYDLPLAAALGHEPSLGRHRP